MQGPHVAAPVEALGLKSSFSLLVALHPLTGLGRDNCCSAATCHGCSPFPASPSLKLFLSPAPIPHKVNEVVHLYTSEALTGKTVCAGHWLACFTFAFSGALRPL